MVGYPDDHPTGRALELADIVAYHLFGGSRGWETCTYKQFRELKRRLNEKLRVPPDKNVARPENNSIEENKR